MARSCAMGSSGAEGRARARRGSRPRAAAALSLVVAGLTGCSSRDPDVCRWKEDCPAGQTCADGVCTTIVPLPDRGGADALPADQRPADVSMDRGPAPDSAPSDGALCTPDNDGKIARSELQFAIPSGADYTVGSGVAVDLDGVEVGGIKQWDLSAAATDDHTEAMKLDPVPAWAAADFPKGPNVYSSLLNKSYDTYGVFQVTDKALQLLGAISGDEKYGRATYAQPVELLRFPLAVGDSYTTETSASGYWGIAVLYNVETYTVDVLARGTVKLPKMLPIDALLVREVAEQYPYGNPFLKKTYTVFLLMAECFGTVARVVVDGDPGDKLAFAAADVRERWRLSSP